MEWVDALILLLGVQQIPCGSHQICYTVRRLRIILEPTCGLYGRHSGLATKKKERFGMSGLHG